MTKIWCRLLISAGDSGEASNAPELVRGTAPRPLFSGNLACASCHEPMNSFYFAHLQGAITRVAFMGAPPGQLEAFRGFNIAQEVEKQFAGLPTNLCSPENLQGEIRRGLGGVLPDSTFEFLKTAWLRAH